MPRLRVIGPMLKAGLFESVAVPELRVHAEQLAAELLARDQSQPVPSSHSVPITLADPGRARRI